MKTIATFIVLCLLLSSQTLFAQDYTIDATNGTVVGDQQYGNPVHLYANPAPEGTVFTGWVGPDANKLALADEWHTTFVANNTDGTAFALRATYDSLGTADFGEMQFPGYTESMTLGVVAGPRRVVYALPPAEDVKAIVFMLHGTNGSAADWSQRYEQQAVRKDLVYNGYAVFAIDANEQVVGDQNTDGAERWLVSAQKTDTSSNIDLKNLVALERFVRGFLGEKPVFTYGGSNGANFADFSAATLDYTGVCHAISNGNTWLYNQTQIDLKPAIWIQSRNDQNSSADSMVAKANYQSLVDKGVATEFFWLDKAPVYTTRFRRSLEPISAAQSIRIWGDLLAANYTNLDGYITVDRIKSDFDDAAFFANSNFSENQKSEIINQLEILNAEHTPHSDYSKQVIRFFDSLLPGITAIQEAQNSIDLAVYPNPTSDIISLQLEQQSNYSFQLFSAIGERITSGTFSENSKILSLARLSTGVYLLEVMDIENEDMKTVRILKK